MRYGISAGALVLHSNKVLLVHHKETSNYDFWVPPGGRLEGEESIFECARRETFEETGLSVQPERIIYIQEFVEPDYHFCKFFVLCTSLGGELTLTNCGHDEAFLIDAQFMAKNQLEALTVYPAVMKDQFWSDVEAGFPCTRYLGLERIVP